MARKYYREIFQTVEAAIEFVDKELKNFPICGYDTDLHVSPMKDGTFAVHGSRCGSCG